MPQLQSDPEISLSAHALACFVAIAMLSQLLLRLFSEEQFPNRRNILPGPHPIARVKFRSPDCPFLARFRKIGLE